MNLIELYNSGVIKHLCQKGLISPSTVAYFDYFKAFENNRKTCSYREAVMMTALEFKVSESTIERAVRMLQEKPSKS